MAAHLHAWAPEKLDKLLEALDVPVAAREERQRKIDPRRCRVCGNGYVRCRQIDEKAPEEDRHEWMPNVNRAGEEVPE